MHVAHRCNLFDNKAEGHDAVGHRECVGVAQIDFVLAGRIFVKAVLNRNAHGLKRADGFFAQRTSDIRGGEIEKTALVEWHWSTTVIAWREIEVLDVGRNIKHQAKFAGGFKIASQYLSRVAFKRCAIQLSNVTKNACFGRLSVNPRQYFKRVGVGQGEHVGLLYAAVSING